MNKIKFLFLLPFIFLSCASIPNNEKFQNSYENTNLSLEELLENFESTKIEEGFELFSGKIEKLKVSWHCVKIDLSNPKLIIKAEPENQQNIGKKISLKKFAKKNDTIVAINSTPFTKKAIPIGITKINQKIITQKNQKYCALGFFYDKNQHLKAKIIDFQNDENIKNCDFAFGGFFKTHNNDDFFIFNKNRRSRTACGLNNDGSVLYFLVATPDFKIDDKNGLTYEECAKILNHFECKTSMQFDGGCSSGLSIYNKMIEKPFFQRKIASALGFSIN